MAPIHYEALSCNVCFEWYGQGDKCPRILACGHSFCQSCLTNILKNNRSCPSCRKRIKYLSVQDIPPNYDLRNLAEVGITSLANNLCDNNLCKDHESYKRWECVDCKQIICGSCRKMNHKLCQTNFNNDTIKEKKKMWSQQLSKTEIFLKVETLKLKKRSKELEAKRAFIIEQTTKLNQNLRDIDKTMTKTEQQLSKTSIKLAEVIEQKKSNSFVCFELISL